MKKLTISQTKDYFIKDGKVFFYLADTIWSAFSKISLEQWEEYVLYRYHQGFNVLQINIQPQWDAGESVIKLKPFMTDSSGKKDFFKINEEYFIKAQQMLEFAVKKNFIPALVVLWCDNVADTWASKRLPDHLMPYEAVESYVEYVVRTFSRFDPIYIISGDTDFGSKRSIEYYMTALKKIKSISPDALTTMHLQPNVFLPEIFINSEYLDFYMYQSGHKIEEQDLCYKLAQKYYGQSVKKPIVNAEPCYEGSGYGFKYGRFIDFDVRKAVWQSLLSGAKAGIAYGSHGVWGWYKDGIEFTEESFSSRPFAWQNSLRFDGAWDVSFAKWIFENYKLFDIEPKSLIRNETEEIRMSATNDFSKTVIYSPYNIDIKVSLDLSGYDWLLIDLSGRRFAKPEVKIKKDYSIIRMHNFNSDVLILGIK